jgi:hypothetical protein
MRDRDRWCNVDRLAKAGMVVRVRGLHAMQPVHERAVCGRGLLVTPARPTMAQIREWSPSLWTVTPQGEWHTLARLLWECEIGALVG